MSSPTIINFSQWIFPLLILSDAILLPSNLMAQEEGNCTNSTFEFDFHGSGSNTTITCGKIINEAIWKVAGDTCTNTSDTIWLGQAECSGSNNFTKVKIQIDREGQQVTNEDFIIVDIYCNQYLVSTDTTWGLWPAGSGMSNVRIKAYDVSCAYPDYMIIRVTIGTREPNAQLKQLSGESCMNCYTNELLPMVISDEKLWSAANDVYYAFNLDLTESNNKLEDARIILGRSANGKLFRPILNSIQSVDGNRLILRDPSPHPDQLYYQARVLINGESTHLTRILHCDGQYSGRVRLIPNPVNKEQSIRVEAYHAVKKIEISDVTGRVLLLQKTDFKTNVVHMTIDEITNPGIYILTVYTMYGIKSLKFIAN